MFIISIFGSMRGVLIRPFSIVYLIFLVFLGWFMLDFLTDCSSNNKSFSKPIRDQYLGDISCSECHQKEYLEWKGSHHDLAMQTASDSTVLGDFENTSFESNGVSSSFYKRYGKYYVNTEGPDGTYQDFEVLYTFGVKPLQQYMVALPGGRLQCLLTAWDTEEKKWFDLMPDERLQSDDWLHWTGGSMTWNTMCADCHSTHLEKSFDATTNSFDTKWQIINVSCEACHGPGEKHVNYVNSNVYKEGESLPDSHLYMTAEQGSQEQVEDCGRCHARRGPISEVFDHSGVMMDHYLPDILRPGLYHADGQILDEVYVYGSFLQSKMYRHKVRCTNCHNAHSMELLFEGNTLCTQCHVPSQYDVFEHHFHESGTESAACISCHMPGKIYMGNDFRRDHSFRVPRPDLSAKYGTPNACTGCHQDQSAEWASLAVNKWYGHKRIDHYSDVLVPVQNGDLSFIPGLMDMIGDTSKPKIVQATAVWLLGQMPVQEVNLKIQSALKDSNAMIRYAAVNALEASSQENRIRYLTPLLNDSVKAVRSQAAYIMADINDRLIGDANQEILAKAKADFMNVLAVQADFPAGQLQRGQYYHKQKNYAKAEEAYLMAVEMDPYLAHAYYNMANLYYQQNDLKKAEQAFIKVVTLQDDAADAYYSLGLLQAEMGNLAGAANNLGKAASISENPRHYYNWGLTLQNLQKPKEAEQAFKDGLAISPDFEPLMYALSILYIQQNESNKANSLVQQLIKINPNNPDYQSLLRAVQ